MRKVTRQRGFTLIEVLVATVVLTLGLIGALTAFSIASRASGASRNATLIPLLAEQKLSEVKSIPRDTLKAGITRGDFGTEYPGYTWELRIAAPDELHVVRVDLIIYAMELGRTRDVTYTTAIF